MSLTRAEAANMSNGALQILIDGRRSRLRRAWERGSSGSLSDIYDLAVAEAEAVVRAYAVKPPTLPGQMAFDFAVWSEVMRVPPQSP